jgi:hypothetical protein
VELKLNSDGEWRARSTMQPLRPLRSTLSRREMLLSLVAIVCLLGAVLTVYALSPTRLRVAVAQGDPAGKLMQAWAQTLSETRAGFRLEVMAVATFEEAAGLLQRGEVDLTVIRPERALPDRGMTIALLNVQAIVFIVLPERGVDAIEELGGRRIGVLKEITDGPQTIDRLSRLVGWAKMPSVVPLGDGDLGNREALQRVDALLHIAPLSGGEFNRLLAKLDGGFKGKTVEILTFENAATLAQRDPTLEQVELEAGSLSSKPKRPDDKSSTLGTSLRLMAGADLGRGTVYDITRSLFESRTRLARLVPFANNMTAPESSTSALLPIHPGTIDYLERDQQTFFSRYSDIIYIGASVVGGLVSAFAAVSQRFLRKRREKIDEILSALVNLMREARDASSVADLDGLSVIVDGIVSESVQATLHRTTDMRAMSALILTTDSVRHAIEDRRKQLGRESTA